MTVGPHAGARHKSAIVSARVNVGLGGSERDVLRRYGRIVQNTRPMELLVGGFGQRRIDSRS